jgi:hypothetical protein
LQIFVSICRLILLAGTAGVLQGQRSDSPQATANVPLLGHWRLNLARTHYGNGVDVRQREKFTCEMVRARLHCVIRSVRHNGHEVVGQFTALLDGSPAAVNGIPEVDSVQLTRPNAALLDATFFFQHKPVFAYRAYRSSDDRSLLIVSIDPKSRAALTTVVVYDRQ